MFKARLCGVRSVTTVSFALSKTLLLNSNMDTTKIEIKITFSIDAAGKLPLGNIKPIIEIQQSDNAPVVHETTDKLGALTPITPPQKYGHILNKTPIQLRPFTPIPIVAPADHVPRKRRSHKHSRELSGEFSKSLWIRDLCKEGIEPNPGPSPPALNWAPDEDYKPQFFMGEEVSNLKIRTEFGPIPMVGDDITEAFDRRDEMSKFCSKRIANAKRCIRRACFEILSVLIDDTFDSEAKELVLDRAKFELEYYMPHVDFDPLFEIPLSDVNSYRQWIRDLTAEGVEPNPGPFLHWYYAVLLLSIKCVLGIYAISCFVLMYLGIPLQREHWFLILYLAAIVQFLQWLSDSNPHGWIKDLTEEGIEPNPGPVLSRHRPTPASMLKGMSAQMAGFFDFLSMNVKLDSESRQMIDNLGDKLVDAADLLSDVKVSHEVPVIEKIFAFLKDVDQRRLLVTVIAACMKAYDLYHKRSSTLTTVVMAYAALLWISGPVKSFSDSFCGGIMSALSDAVTRLVAEVHAATEPRKSVGEAGEEMFEPQFNSGQSVTHLLLSCVYMSVYHKDGTPYIKTFLHSLKDLPRMCEGLDFYIDKLMSCIIGFLNWCSQQIFDRDMIGPQYEDREIQGLYDRMETLITKLKSDNNQFNYDTAIVLYQLERELEVKLLRVQKGRRGDQTEAAALKTLLQKLRPFSQRMERSCLENNGPRKECFGILIGGSTGVGKSTASLPLALAFAGAVMPESMKESFMRNHNDHIWPYFPENEYSDAYHGQFVVVYDELAAVRDGVGAPDEGALFLLHAMGNLPFNMHAASLEEKGKMLFTSRIMVATTNREQFDYKSMVSSEAITRRFKVSVKCVPKIEFCFPLKPGESSSELSLRRLDTSKVSLIPGDLLDVSIYEYYDWNYDTGKRADSGKIWSFQELIDECIRKYNEADAWGNTYLSSIEHYKKLYINHKPAASEKRTSVPGTFGPQGADPESIGSSTTTLTTGDTFSSNLSSLREAMNTFLGQHKRKLGAAALMCMALTTGYTVYKLLFKDLIFPQSGVYKLKPTQSKTQRKFERTRAKVVHFTSQGCVTENSQQFATKIVRRNMYTLRTPFSDRAGHVLFLKGRIMVMPAHYYDSLERYYESTQRDFVIDFYKPLSTTGGFSLNYTDIQFGVGTISEEYDTIYAKIPKVCAEHPDITGCFMTPEDKPKLTSKFSAILCLPRKETSMLIVLDATKIGAVDYGDNSINDGFVYDVDTSIGDCGAPLISIDKRLGKPVIIGFHVAGGGGRGLSTCIYKPDIEAVCKGFAEEVSVSYTLDDTPDIIGHPDELMAQMDAKFVVRGYVKPVPMPLKSNIERAPLYGKWGPATQKPSMLREKNGIDPWKLARDKYSGQGKPLNLKLLHLIATAKAKNYGFMSTFNREPRIFTIEEAVAGIPGDDYFDGIPRSTSAGYGLKVDGYSGKHAYFGKEGDYEFTSPEWLKLKAQIEREDAEMGQGKRQHFVYIDYLKDERRPIAKADAGKSRLFSACQLNLLIHGRRYFGAFIQWIRRNHTKNGIAIGINPYSSDWDVLAKFLLSKGFDGMIFGDYAGYDGSLYATIMLAALPIIESFYWNSTLWDRIKRYVIIQEIINSVHLSSEQLPAFLYEWNGSNPSGQFATTEFNSICGHLILVYAFVLILIKKRDLDIQELSISDLEKIVWEVVTGTAIIDFGDDNGISLTDTLRKEIDPPQLTLTLKEMGFVYTDEQKSNDALKYKRLEECTFLKRGFRYEERLRRYVAPLALETILEMGYWTRKSATEADYHRTLETAVLELALHPRKVYDRYAPLIIRAARSELNLVIEADYEINQLKCCGLQMRY